jgi:hypothetical protein
MKLTQKNYYSKEMNEQYFSVSQYKDFCKCEAMAMAKINGTYQQPKSRALILGSLFDELLTGTQKSYDKFVAENKDELFKKDGKPYADVAQAFETAKKFKEQPLMMKYLTGQNQKIMTGTIAGVPFKIKMDVFSKDNFITDLKYMASLRSPNLFESMVKYWGYDIQGAVYQEVVYQNIKKELPFFLNIATKETLPHLELCEIKQYDLDDALRNVEKNVPRFQAIKNGLIEPERCEEYDCPYCTATRIITEPIDSNMLGMTRKIET